MEAVDAELAGEVSMVIVLRHELSLRDDHLEALTDLALDQADEELKIVFGDCI